MKLIEKIEIKNFRSFDNRLKSKTQISKIADLNIFSGANDSGKSNVLRALNLFFNKKTNLIDFLDFNNDFFKRKIIDDSIIKEEMITVRISFWNEKNKNKNKENDFVRLPERFWVSRKWTKTSTFGSFNQDDGVETSFRKEKGNKYKDYYDNEKGKSKGKLKQHVQASLSRQLSAFLESIQFHYVPAIKDKSYFSHLYGELQQTLLKEINSEVNTNKQSFEQSIQKSTKDLMQEFEKVVKNKNFKISAVFELPDLIELFKTLIVQTGEVNLLYRGDGIQAKLIPEILNFIAIKELQIRPSKIKQGEKQKKYFIWGFEEPENSYEYRNANLLANRLKDVFINNAQIFISTHSFNFISLEGKNISTYRVWKDEKLGSSRISKIKKEINGQFVFENDELNDDSERLNEELGVFQLNKDLEVLFLDIEKKKNEFLSKMKEINKPVIYTEGDNAIYLKKAKEFFAPALDIDIESLGGKDDLKKFFQRFTESNFSRYKIFFVFDVDAQYEFNCCEARKTDFLIPYIFKNNVNNTLIELVKGIENLFNDDLFIDETRFFSITETTRDRKIISRKRTLRKQEFREFICNERNSKNDFANFSPFFEKVNKLLNNNSQ